MFYNERQLCFCEDCGNSKSIPVQAMKTCRENWGVASFFTSALGVHRHDRTNLPRERTPVLTNGSVGEPVRTVLEKTPMPLPEFELPIAHPVA